MWKNIPFILFLFLMSNTVSEPRAKAFGLVPGACGTLCMASYMSPGLRGFQPLPIYPTNYYEPWSPYSSQWGYYPRSVWNGPTYTDYPAYSPNYGPIYHTLPYYGDDMLTRRALGTSSFAF